jgi:hypothetical protein
MVAVARSENLGTNYSGSADGFGGGLNTFLLGKSPVEKMIARAKTWIVFVKRSTLARNSVWMFLGYGMRIIVQAGYFVLIARALGPHEYGAFVGATALIGIVGPFGGIGGGNLLVKIVSPGGVRPGAAGRYRFGCALGAAASNSAPADHPDLPVRCDRPKNQRLDGEMFSGNGAAGVHGDFQLVTLFVADDFRHDCFQRMASRFGNDLGVVLSG